MLNEYASSTLLELSFSCKNVKIYVFGSFLRKSIGIGDLDLLVVFSDLGDLTKLRDALEKMGRMIPLDVIYMHRDEERELDFIVRQGAKEISEVWFNVGIGVANEHAV